MADQQASPSSSQGSQQSTEDARFDATIDTSSSLATLYEPTKHLPKAIHADLELIATYLVKEKAPGLVQAALSRVRNTYN
jgi:hypothetical protein